MKEELGLGSQSQQSRRRLMMKQKFAIASAGLLLFASTASWASAGEGESLYKKKCAA
jgi:hypothetical protein